MCYLRVGRKWFQCIGYDNTVYVDYMDLAVCGPRKAVKFNHSPPGLQKKHQLHRLPVPRSELHEPRIFYPFGHWPEPVTNAHVSAYFR